MDDALPLIVECDACLEPTRANATCARCGATAVSAPGRARVVDAPYRSAPKDERIKLLPFELARAPSSTESEQLLVEWRAAKADLAGSHDDEVELRATWLAAVLAAAYAERGEPLREQAVLETAWSRVVRPVHRATIAARLVRRSARAGARARAEAWLATITMSTGVPEVDADVAVARAVLAHARGEDEAAMQLMGAAPSSQVIGGAARVLASVVRLAVLEERADAIGARRARDAAEREHGAASLARVARRLDLERHPRALSTRRLAAVAFAIATLLVVLAWLVIATT